MALVPLGSHFLSLSLCYFLCLQAIEGASSALQLLENHHIPFVLLTNSGGCTESQKARQVSHAVSELSASFFCFLVSLEFGAAWNTVCGCAFR